VRRTAATEASKIGAARRSASMELHELDLNLLVIFDQLRIERRVSKVAENLDISQPAVSNSLAKLRKLLSDELFLRTPKGMEPTPYADQLFESVSAALALIHGGVNRGESSRAPPFSFGPDQNQTAGDAMPCTPSRSQLLDRYAPGPFGALECAHCIRSRPAPAIARRRAGRALDAAATAFATFAGLCRPTA